MNKDNALILSDVDSQLGRLSVSIPAAVMVLAGSCENWRSPKWETLTAKNAGATLSRWPAQPRGACAKIEIPGDLSGEASMMTTNSPPANFGYAPGESSPRFEAAPLGPTVSATVKWYNPEKGFGFVQLPSGGDAFLHVSVVERSGNSTVPPGATLEVRAAPGQKGMQITELLSVDASTTLQEQPRRPRPERPHQPSDQAAVEEIGTVKWYNPDKGFGFIVRDLGGKDIFVHASALNRGGLAGLSEGQRVAVDMIEGGKGPEAVNIRLV